VAKLRIELVTGKLIQPPLPSAMTLVPLVTTKNRESASTPWSPT